MEGIREHPAALQAIANAHGGNRLAGTAGYDASVAYVRNRALAAGFEVRVQDFQFTIASDRTPPVLRQTSPAERIYDEGRDFATLQYSGSGDVTAPIVAVDMLAPAPAPNASTSGCEAADFAGFPAGAIALVQRGTCTFRVKVDNATAAGAAAVIIANDGGPARTGPIPGTLGPPQARAPAVGTTFAVGEQLRGGVLAGPTGPSLACAPTLWPRRRRRTT